MPWDVKKDDRCPASKPWAVTNKDTDRLVACHVDKDSARQQQKALYANVPESDRSYEADTGQCLELATELAQCVDNGARILGSMDVTDMPPPVAAALDQLAQAKALVAQLIGELQPDEGVDDNDDAFGQDDEMLAYDQQQGLPYVIMFDYRSDGGPLLVGPFPTRWAATDYVHTLEPFDAEWMEVPVSKP